MLDISPAEAKQLAATQSQLLSLPAFRLRDQLKALCSDLQAFGFTTYQVQRMIAKCPAMLQAGPGVLGRAVASLAAAFQLEQLQLSDKLSRRPHLLLQPIADVLPLVEAMLAAGAVSSTTFAMLSANTWLVDSCSPQQLKDRILLLASLLGVDTAIAASILADRLSLLNIPADAMAAAIESWDELLGQYGRAPPGAARELCRVCPALLGVDRVQAEGTLRWLLELLGEDGLESAATRCCPVLAIPAAQLQDRLTEVQQLLGSSRRATTLMYMKRPQLLTMPTSRLEARLQELCTELDVDMAAVRKLAVQRPTFITKPSELLKLNMDIVSSELSVSRGTALMMMTARPGMARHRQQCCAPLAQLVAASSHWRQQLAGVAPPALATLVMRAPLRLDRLRFLLSAKLDGHVPFPVAMCMPSVRFSKRYPSYAAWKQRGSGRVGQ